MTEKKSSGYRNIGIGVGIAVGVIIAVIAIYFLFMVATKPKEVLVSGTVTTTGTGTSPQMVTFTSMRNGKTYVANANGGSYSISLPNGDSYSVTITWKFLGITGGNADAGTLNLDTTETSITRNWAG
jgi:hypothetical protein